MNNSRKNVVPILGLLAAVAAFVAGNEVRTRQDVGQSVSSLQNLGVRSIIAAKDDVRPVGEAEFFFQLTLLLEREYVDRVGDEMSLANGAIRGMVNGLLEPESRYLDEVEFKAHLAATEGKVEGIGIETTLRYDAEALRLARESLRKADPLLMLPDLLVTAVFPGSPAEAAGIRVSDRVIKLDGKWVLSHADIKAIREVRERAAKGKATPGEVTQSRKDFQAKADDAKLAVKARESLLTGTGKTHEVSVLRDGKRLDFKVKTGVTPRPAVTRSADGTIRLQFVRGAGAALSEALDSGATVIDLRQSGLGSPKELIAALSAAAPAGGYGTLSAGMTGAPRPLTVESGKGRAALTLIVDETTQGTAEIFALALAKSGKASLSGKSAGRPLYVETNSLPDGNGFVLLTARWATENGK